MDEETRRYALKSLNGFSDKNVLVVGDSILDINIYSQAIGLSLETPTIKAKEKCRDYSLGGAANVVQNILELGAKCSFITLLGDDSDSEFYKKFKNPNFSFHPIIEPQRKTTVKTRFWVERGTNQYKALQIDKLDNSPIEPESEKNIIHLLDSLKYDSLIIADYRHGMMSKPLIESIKSLKNKDIFIITSSQVSEHQANHQDYSGVNLICMNEKEAKEVLPGFRKDNISELGSFLSSGVCVTLGESGAIMSLEGKVYNSKGFKVKEVDSCGAGDSFLAALSLLDIKENPLVSLYTANAWASLSVQQPGTKVPKLKNLSEMLI
jgi:rfaE bifunctional protein kinase chain/domain